MDCVRVRVCAHARLRAWTVGAPTGQLTCGWFSSGNFAAAVEGVSSWSSFSFYFLIRLASDGAKPFPVSAMLLPHLALPPKERKDTSVPRPASVHAALATAPHRNTFSSKMRMLVLSSQISKKLSKTSHLSLPLARHTDLARQLPVFNQAEPFGADRYAGRAVSSSLDGRWWRPRASWACCTEGVGFLAALLQAVGRVLFFAHGLATVRLSVQPVSVAARSWRRSLCSQRPRSRHSCGRRSSHPALCRCASPVCQQDGGVEARVSGQAGLLSPWAGRSRQRHVYGAPSSPFHLEEAACLSGP